MELSNQSIRGTFLWGNSRVIDSIYNINSN